MKKNLKLFEALIPLALGLISFFIFSGYLILYPSNIVWFDQNGNDPLTHYLGWAIFRNGPLTFPLGLNPNFGLDISSSIVYSDSIPLIAIPLKLFNSILPTTLQYFGIWVLICYILQAVVAWLLLGLMTKDIFLKFFASGLLIFVPMMIIKISDQAALVSHFLILSSLYLIFRSSQKYRIFWWAICLVTAILVHSYLFAIVFIIWLTDLAERTVNHKTLSLQKLLKELVLNLMIVSFFAWQEGYFTISFSSAATTETYGSLGIDLLSLFGSRGWSYLLPDIRAANHWPEGFIYLGLGGIVSLMAAFFCIISRRFNFFGLLKNHIFLLLCCFILTAFAMTHHIVFGTWRYEFKIPESLLILASTLRFSARTFWPVFYCLILGSIYIIINFFTKKNALFILSACFLLQLIDTSAGWLPLRNKLMQVPANNLGSPLQSPFWYKAAKHYTKVELVPLVDWPIQPRWFPFANYAASYGLATNAVYLSRVDSNKVAAANLKFESILSQGNADPSSLYILDDHIIPSIFPFINRSTDFLARVDNFNVLAPKFKTCQECPLSAEEKQIDLLMPSFKIGETIFFGINGLGKNLATWGWAEPEPWGAWSNMAQATLDLPVPLGARLVTLNVNALISKSHPIQHVIIQMNGQPNETFNLDKAENNKITLVIPNSALLSRHLRIKFIFMNSVSPKALGVGLDARKLSLGLVSVLFQ